MSVEFYEKETFEEYMNRIGSTGSSSSDNKPKGDEKYLLQKATEAEKRIQILNEAFSLLRKGKVDSDELQGKMVDLQYYSGICDPYYEDHINLTYADAEYRYQNVENVSYELQVSTPKGIRFYGVMKVGFDLKNLSLKSLHLDFAGDRIYYITVNGCDISSGYVFEHHKLFLPVEKLKQKGNVVEIAYTNKYNRKGCGLHSYVDPADNERYLYTQFECPYCNSFMPCFDQPSLKAFLTLSFLAPAHWTVIANQPHTSNGSYVNGELPLLLSRPFNGSSTKLWKFSTTPKISTYLYAVCAGNFFVREADPSRKWVTPMRLFVRRSYSKLLSEEYALQWFEVSDHGLRFHGDLMGEKYPYEKLDQIICPEYNWGAMENVGCITYNECYLWKTTPTRGAVVRAHCTILHELAHQWFGNLVTMHWWEDLWLNESFATYVATLAQLKYKNEGEDAEIQFLGETVWGIFTDQRETTHPIANEASAVRDTEVTETIFDGISYGKGGSWLKQFYKYVGPAVFRDGVQRYFANFRGGNTRLRDFVESMDKASEAAAQKSGVEKRDVVKWANKWLTEQGVMILSADVGLKNGKIENFVIKHDFAQYADKKYKEHKMDIVIYNKDMVPTRKEVMVLAEAETNLTNEFIGLDCSAVMLNSGCHSYVKVCLDPSWVTFMIENFSKIISNFDKNYLAVIMYDMVRDGKLNPVLFVKSVVKYVLKEKQVTMLQRSLGRSITVARNFIDPQHRKKYCTMLFNALVDALRSSEEKERKTLLVKQLLQLLNTEANLKRAKNWLSSGNMEGKHELEKCQKRDILIRLCGANWITEADKDALVKKYIGEDSDSDAKKYLKMSNVARPNKNNKQKWWAWLINPPETASQEVYRHVCHAFTIGLSAELGRTFADDYFVHLPLLFKKKGHFFGRQFCSSVYPGEADPSVNYSKRLEKVVKANQDKGLDKDKFLEKSGVQLHDLWKRFQKGWEITDSKVWMN